ncbi:MAG: hypothetical protein AB7N71_14960 [Phycisphaerae bacterium]
MRHPSRTAVVALAGFAVGVAVLYLTAFIVEPVFFATLYPLLETLGVSNAAEVGRHRLGGGCFRLDRNLPVVPTWALFIDGWLWRFARGALAGVAVLIAMKVADSFLERANGASPATLLRRVRYHSTFWRLLALLLGSGATLLLTDIFYSQLVSRFVPIYVFLTWPVDYVAPLVIIVSSAMLLLRRTAENGPPACLRCGYLLIGIASDRCPECGTMRRSSGSDAHRIVGCIVAPASRSAAEAGV